MILALITPPPIPVELVEAVESGLISRLTTLLYNAAWWALFTGGMFGVGLAVGLIAVGYLAGRTARSR